MDTSSSDSEVAGPSTSRRRLRNPETWAQNVAKKKRNTGQAYVSRANKQEVRARAVGAPCSDGCFNKLTRPVIDILFKEFWEIGSFDLQNAFLQKQVRAKEVKRRRKGRDPTTPPRARRGNYEYVVTHNGVDTVVCAQGFRSIYDLSRRRIETALKKVGESSTPTQDKRGKHPQARTITGVTKDRVNEHINNFPTVTSHYTRAKSPHRRYMDATLSIEKLYRMYLTWMGDEHPEEKKVTASFYRKVFTEEFNISFKPPMTDTCNRCDELKAVIKRAEEDQDEEGKSEAEQALRAHMEVADEGQRAMKDYAKNQDDDVRVICIDLQQTLPMPRSSTNVAYYKRKMWCYNFCIHDIKKNVSKFYVWDEVSGGRGSVEIVSCLRKWLLEEYDREEFGHLVIFSDNCGGQNKNINMVLHHLREVHSGRFTIVEHIFLVPGHSFMACDRAFGNIEKQIRLTGDVYDFKGYVHCIANAVHSTFEVVHMKREDFVDIDLMKKYVVQRKVKVDQVRFKDARKLVCSHRYREGYFIGMQYSDNAPLETVRLMPGRANYAPSKFNLSKVELPPKYPKVHRLKKDKIRDLRILTSFMSQQNSAYLLGIIEEQEQVFQGQPEDSSDEYADEEALDNDLLDYDA